MPSLSISTRWNAFRHGSGEAMVEEILQMGFGGIELGYDLTADLTIGVNRMVNRKAVKVVSVHNFCPVPVGAPQGHPELFELASPSTNTRDNAVQLTAKTIRFAAEMQADTVVVHCGNIHLLPSTRKLIALHNEGKRYSDRFEKSRMKMMMKRDKAAGKHLDALYTALDEILPVLEETGIRMGIENLPSWESIPTEQELVEILDRFQSPFLSCWHDIGHGRIRQNLGFINQLYWVEKLADRTAGMHIHDVAQAASDHLMPPLGQIDFKMFEPFIEDDMLLVLEPAPGTPAEEVMQGKALIEEAWNSGETEQ